MKAELLSQYKVKFKIAVIHLKIKSVRVYYSK